MPFYSTRISSVDVFVIDPPWPKKKGGIRAVRPNQTREMDYRILSVSEIFSLLDTRVFPLGREAHTVFLWSIDQYLLNGEYEMEQRGYKRHSRLIWDKLNGVAPAFSVRYTHEYVTWFYKPVFRPVSVASQGKVATVFREPSREHSRKPDALYRMIEFWYPGASKLDVFSREKRLGWEQWGDECNHFVDSRDQKEEANKEDAVER